MRPYLLALALVGFTGLALIDLATGDVRRGTAALLLVLVNWLLLA